MQLIQKNALIATLLLLSTAPSWLLAMPDNSVVVKKSLVPICFSTLGTLVADQKIEVTSRITGYLKSIYIKEGQKVKKGQLLAVIDEANTKGQILDFKAKVNQANSALKDALLDAKKFALLYKSGSISENQYRKAELNYNLAVDRLAAIKANLAVAKSQLVYTHIVSPIDGNITELYQQTGDMASPGVAIARIETISTLEFKTEIPERNIYLINTGDKVHLTIDAMTSAPAIEGAISRIIPSSSRGTHSFQVFITPLYQPNALPGMFGHVKIFTKAEKKIIIPKASIVDRNSLQGVFITHKNTRIFRWLRLGEPVGNGIEILAGLREGDVISLHSEMEKTLFSNLDASLSDAIDRGVCL